MARNRGVHRTKLKTFSATEKQVQGFKLLTAPGNDYARILFDGGARSGKTVAAARWMILRAIQFPRSKQIVARMRAIDLRRSGWMTFKEHLADYFPKAWWIAREKDFVLKFMNGSYIQFTGLDTKERIDFILGTEWLTIFINEATQIPYDTVTTVQTRLAQKVEHRDTGMEGTPKILADCNPRHTKHWIHQLCIDRILPNSDPPTEVPEAARWQRLSWSPYDNAQNLPNAFFITLNHLPPIKRARMRDGLWKNNEGAVYEEFDEDIHVVEPFAIPAGWKLVRGIDFGYTNPFVCLWGAVDHDGRLYVYREHYKSEVIVSEHAQLINSMSLGEQYIWTVADWDAEDRATLQQSGIKTVQADKRISVGIEQVKRRLKVQRDQKPRIFFFRGRCPYTVNEFYDYMWPQNPPTDKSPKEEPIDKDNHAMDALRYMVMRLDQGSGSSKFAGLYKREVPEDSLMYEEALEPAEMT